ncbi:MAG: Hsp20 family protein [Bacteriovorax sp.]|nr:Hsp20 family protein [Bacteriovorax sp.]
MNIKIKKIFFLLFSFAILVSSLSSFAQTGQEQEVQRQINELMKAREEMLKSLLNDSDFQGLDKHFEDLVKRFEKESLGAGPGMDMGDVVGEYDWRETPTHQVFVLKVKQVKDKPLDIKIEKGQIKLKGDVESVDIASTKSSKSKRTTKVHFERTFSIPDGVDQGNPDFENKAGELLIKFKKLKTSKVPSKIKSIEPVDQRRPIGKDADDLTI